jgi:hypothetical protein
MNKQTLTKRKKKATSARRSAREAAQEAFARFLDDGSPKALDDYAKATAKADALADAVDKIGDKIDDKKKSRSLTPATRTEIPFDREAHRKKKEAYIERLNELAHEFRDAHGWQATSMDDVKKWAKRTDRDLPEEPERPGASRRRRST